MGNYQKGKNKNITCATIGASHKETKVKYLVYIMEKAIQKMEESQVTQHTLILFSFHPHIAEQGVEKLLWVVDFKDNSQMHGMSLMKVSKEILDILQDHYPGITFVFCFDKAVYVLCVFGYLMLWLLMSLRFAERLGGALVINAPWVFHALWKVIAPSSSPLLLLFFSFFILYSLPVLSLFSLLSCFLFVI